MIFGMPFAFNTDVWISLFSSTFNWEDADASSIASVFLGSHNNLKICSVRRFMLMLFSIRKSELWVCLHYSFKYMLLVTSYPGFVLKFVNNCFLNPQSNNNVRRSQILTIHRI